MKIAIRKIRCPNCERLVNTREQANDDTIQLYCVRCNELIRAWDGIKWLTVRK